MGENLTTSVQRGTNTDGATNLVARIARIDWFHRTADSNDNGQVDALVGGLCGQFGLADVLVKRLDAAEFASFIGSYNIAANALWDHVKNIPDRVQARAVELGRTERLSYAFHDVPESVFHKAFDGAFHRFGGENGEAIRFAVSAAMFVCALAVAWESVMNGDGMESNPLLPALSLFEQGYLPLGLIQGVFYLC